MTRNQNSKDVTKRIGIRRLNYSKNEYFRIFLNLICRSSEAVLSRLGPELLKKIYQYQVSCIGEFIDEHSFIL